MKKLIFLSLLILVVMACNNSPKSENITVSDGTTNNDISGQNSIELSNITKTIHDFYKWYDAFQMDQTRNIGITDDSGKHLVLDTTKMTQYFANIKASGFISDEFISTEKVLLKKCEAAWQNEEKGDVPSCMDGDRFFCAQDWDINFWTQAPVNLEQLGTDHVKATLSGTEGGTSREQQLELKKENGKWLITSIYCDMGVGK